MGKYINTNLSEYLENRVNRNNRLYLCNSGVVEDVAKMNLLLLCKLLLY